MEITAPQCLFLFVLKGAVIIGKLVEIGFRKISGVLI